MAYQPGIPTGTVDLDQDYQNIQGNFQQLDTTFGVDHVTYSVNTPQNGYHTSIHLNPVSTTATNPPNNQPLSHVSVPPSLPPLTPNYGQLFSASVNDGNNIDTALYFLTGADRLQQLTSNITPVANTNGYSFIAGGLLIQWGQVTSTASSFQTLNFATNNINFPNNCFAVFTQIYGSGSPPSSTGTIEIRKSTISKTSFQWAMVTGSSQYTGFFWWAIGN